MFFSAGQFEKSVRQFESELFGIFTSAERTLRRNAERLYGAIRTGPDGRMLGDPAALARIDRLRGQITQATQDNLVKPSRAWADQVIPDSWARGRQLARTNLQTDLIDQDLVKESFLHVRPGEKGVLKVGLEDTYKIMGTVGDDIGEFFRSTMTESAILGLPVQGPGDTLANRLFQSGRLQPITIRTADGRIIRRTLRQRAVSIARVETAKVFNRVHVEKTKEVLGGAGPEGLGDVALYANINPEDTRTTPPCEQASDLEPMTLDEWDSSPLGRPPRLKPQFHLCRSFLMGGTRAMFEATRHPSVPKAIDRAKLDVSGKGPGEPAKKETEKQKFVREAKAMIDQGTPTAKSCVELGALILRYIDGPGMTKRRKTVQRATQRKIDNLHRKIKADKNERNRLNDMLHAPRSAEDHLRFPVMSDDLVLKKARAKAEAGVEIIDKRLESLQNKLDDLNTQAGKVNFRDWVETQIIVKALSELRDFGRKKGRKTGQLWNRASPKNMKTAGASRRKVKKAVEDISELLPTDWLEASNKYGKMKAQYLPDSRGSYWEEGLRLELGYENDWRRKSNALHEFGGHRTQHVFGRDILDIEEEFYHYRTPNEKARWLGPPYNRDEYGKRDKFTDEYMGKEYWWEGKQYSYEILTMGLEGVMFNRFNLLQGDPEYYKLILGILASKGKLP